MEFEGQYLTFEEYEELGGTLTKTPFNLLEFEARKQIDLRTQRRLVGIEEIPKDVKLCVYHLINKISSYNEIIEKTNNFSGQISSETVGSYSVSYNNLNPTQINEIIKSKDAELQDIMMNDLYGVIVNGEHIIYNGVVEI